MDITWSVNGRVGKLGGIKAKWQMKAMLTVKSQSYLLLRQRLLSLIKGLSISCVAYYSNEGTSEHAIAMDKAMPDYPLMCHFRCKADT